MSALSALHAERIKLSTTRATVWIAVTVAALSLALAAVQGALAHPGALLTPDRTAIGVAVFGVPVLMVLASMTMTSEYRSGLIRTTFIAVPNRTLVLVSKAVVVSLFSAVYAGLMVVAAVLFASLFAKPSATVGLSAASPAVWRLAAVVAVYGALAAVLGVAVGALLRAAPGAVAVLLLWPLVAEPILGNLPDLGPRIGPYLPFGNMFAFTEVPWLFPVYDMPWGPLGSLGYFTAVVVVAFDAAIIALLLRDA